MYSTSGQHHQLREVDQVAEPGDDRIAEGVDAAAIAEEVDAERLAAALSVAQNGSRDSTSR